MKFIKKVKDCWMYEVEATDDMLAITRVWHDKGIKWTSSRVPYEEMERLFVTSQTQLAKYALMYKDTVSAGDPVVVDTELNIPESTNARYLVYNPLSSLPVTQTYSTQRQARKVAESMAKKQSEPFFVCQVLYGVLQDDNFNLQEIPSDNCR